jgi:hypothetical protein
MIITAERRGTRCKKVFFFTIWYHYHYQLLYMGGSFRTQWWRRKKFLTP